jgi:hypothetical protein
VLRHFTKKRLKRIESHKQEVNNRIKLSYYDDCRKIITNFYNTQSYIESKITEAITEASNSLGYKYNFDYNSELNALNKKIVEISKFNTKSVELMNLEDISSSYYMLNSLLKSFTDVPRNIGILSAKILTRRNKFAGMLLSVACIHDELTHKEIYNKDELKEEIYQKLLSIKDRKEEFYDELLSLSLHYDTLMARYKANNTRKVLNKVLTAIKNK